ncbi:helix-turn-helix transcriptional regulator [Embleya sp. NPDC005971]|uniref:helix-turn-helix transcriptional regulator n=1 Tax=Embleya sp. NPDC005971 TaxID=3156724 RepID=UPI0033E643B2
MTGRHHMAGCPITTEVARRMRHRRLAVRMTTTQQAAAMTKAGYAINHTGISAIEQGRRVELPIRLIAAAAVALQTPLRNLIPGVGPCPACGDDPPAGFSCNDCGAGGASDE